MYAYQYTVVARALVTVCVRTKVIRKKDDKYSKRWEDLTQRLYSRQFLQILNLVMVTAIVSQLKVQW